MRIRSVVAVTLLLLPSTLSAQLIPMPGRLHHPAAQQPMPPEPAPIARQLQYTRLKFSVETYPLLSLVQSAGFAGGSASTWATLGAGTRIEYRVSRIASATFDVTSSVLGGPVNLSSAELGTRIGRARTERRLEPFADLRVGFTSAYSRDVGSYMNDPLGYPIPHGTYGSRYSTGWGAVAGAGLEYGVTNTLSLTTELLATHSGMSAHDVLNPSAPQDYGLTSVRYVLGLRYNPVRMVTH